MSQRHKTDKKNNRSVSHDDGHENNDSNKSCRTTFLDDVSLTVGHGCVVIVNAMTIAIIVAH